MCELNTDTSDDYNTLEAIKTEDTSRRCESVKHFMTGPSTYVAADYGMPVHYMINGKWEDYDNRLTLDENEEKSFRNRSSDIEIKISHKAKENNMVIVKLGENKVTWGYRGVNSAELEIAARDEIPGPADLPNLTQTAWYRDAFTGVDIQYIISPIGVKENFILKTQKTALSYLCEYEYSGLAVTQDDEKTISFRGGDGKAVYMLCAPVMQDAKGGFDSHVTVTITELKNNKVTVRLDICGDWLQADDRRFPVKVDPGFITSQKYDSMDTSWISSGHPTEVLGRSTENMSVGYEMNGYAKTRALVKLRELPKLTPGDVVVNAKLMLAETACLNKMVIYAHRITSGWSPETLCWNTGVTYDPIVLDYELTDGLNSSLKARYWDVTSLMREWYAGTKPNYGIMLISPSENTGSVDRALFSTGLSSIPAARPVFAVTYRHTFGTEKYWTTHSKTCASGVTARVCDNTGNLVVKVPMASTTGSVMPAEFSLVYNSNASYSEFRPGVSSHLTGLGWMATSDCRMDPVENLPEMTSDLSQSLKAQGYDYALTDSDGTIHYLMHDHDYVYKDEDGLGFSMTWDNSTNYYQVTAKDGTMTEFYTTGKIRRMVDSSGNTKWWQYEGPKLYNLKDGAGKNIAVSHSADGSNTRIHSVTDPGGRTASITYSSSCITSVTNAAGISTGFEYGNLTINGKLYKFLTKVFDSDETYTHFSYEVDSNNGFRGRVKLIREYDASGNLGKSVQITYNNDNSTTFATTTNGKTVTETYVFDNFGRTKCVLLDDGTAVNYDYTNSDSGNTSTGQIYRNNKVASTGSGLPYVQNLLKNAMTASSAADWNALGTMTYETSSHAIIGNKCLVTLSSTSSGSSYAYQDVAVTPGQTFTSSAWVHVENATLSDAGGACSLLEFYNGSQYITDTTGPYAKGNIDSCRVTCTATAPAGSTKVRVYFGIRDAAGKVYMSGFQLEKSPVANDFSMLNNYNGRGNWTGGGISATDDGIQPDGTVRITGVYNRYSSFYDESPVNKANPIFNISGFVKANAMSRGRHGRAFALGIKMYYSDGTDKIYPIWFNADSTGWQYVCGQVKPEAANASKIVTKIQTYLLYEHQCNTAYFKDIMVTFDATGSTYTYDDSGNLVSAADNAKNSASYTFNSANELTKLTNVKNESYSYVYSPSNAHRLTAARSSQIGSGFVYGYDSVGNVINTKMGTVSASGVLDTSKPYMETSVGYSSSKSHVTSVTDQRGYVTKFTVDESTGLRSKTTLPDNSSINYEYYPGSQFLKKVTAGGASIEYTYKKGNQLDRILRYGSNYQLNYTPSGKVANVVVGGYKLVSYTYGPNDGPVKTAAYGNGDVLDYEYDKYGRIIKGSMNGTAWFTNEYNKSGQLARTKDHKNSITCNYNYDIIGRSDMVKSGNLSSQYVYDDKNRVKNVTYELLGDSTRMEYTYGQDGRMGTAKHSGGPTYTFSYDSLNRLYQKQVGGLLTDIAYVTASGNKTTSLVGTYSNSVNEAVKYFTRYTYDNMGYITRMEMPGRTVDYQYDALGQMIYCKDSSPLKLMKYEYNPGGNLTARILCNPNTGEEIMREIFTYGDNNWKDLLTSVGGANISYDTIGNPTNYLGMAMSWTARRLNSVSMPNGTQISYSYSPDGIRLSKTVSGVKTEYGYADGLLVYIISGGEKAGIERDSEGNPLAMCYNGTQYSYIKNAQGDIMGIRNQKSGAIEYYKYNELGELNGTYYEDGSSAFDHAAANFNPLRYRGYVYDKETQFYYLNSRYYNPRFGRYINADSYMSTGQGITGNNMFAYCNNNSPLFRDPNGTRIEYMGGGGGIGDKAFNKWLFDSAFKVRMSTVDKDKQYADSFYGISIEGGSKVSASTGSIEKGIFTLVADCTNENGVNVTKYGVAYSSDGFSATYYPSGYSITYTSDDKFFTYSKSGGTHDTTTIYSGKIVAGVKEGVYATTSIDNKWKTGLAATSAAAVLLGPMVAGFIEGGKEILGFGAGF